MLEEWVLAFAASPLVYGAVYVLATIDGFFPPIPSESVVIALAAVAMSAEDPDLWLLLAVAAAGAFTGDQVAYAIGRRVDVRRTRLLRGPRAQRTLDRAEGALAQRGAAFLIGARYIPIGRVAVNMTAGAVGFSRARFVGLTAIAAVSWAFYSVAIGVGAGAWLGDRPLAAVLVGVVGGAVIGLGVDAVLSRVQGRRTGGGPGDTRTTGSPTPVPTTLMPTTAVPTTAVPATAVPATPVPITAVPTTAVPATAVPTTPVPTTAVPTTAVPTTPVPAAPVPTAPARTAGTVPGHGQVVGPGPVLMDDPFAAAPVGGRRPADAMGSERRP